MALDLAARGAKLGLVARRAEALGDVAREIQDKGGEALSLPADVENADSIRSAAESLRSNFGQSMSHRKCRDRSNA